MVVEPFGSTSEGVGHGGVSDEGHRRVEKGLPVHEPVDLRPPSCLLDLPDDFIRYRKSARNVEGGGLVEIGAGIFRAYL